MEYNLSNYTLYYRYPPLGDCGITQEEYRNVLYTVLVIGVIANSVSLFVVYRVKAMRTAINVYLINLSMCDFLYLFVNAIVYITSGFYEDGSPDSDKVMDALKLINYIAFWTSVFTLTFFVLVISADRYAAAAKTHTSAAQTISGYSTFMVSFGAWFVGLSIGCVITFSDVNSLTGAWKVGRHTFLCLVTIMPLIAIGVLHILMACRMMKARRMSTRRQSGQTPITRICLMAVIAFVICILPLAFYFTLGLYSRVTGHYHIVNGEVLLFCIVGYFGFPLIIHFAICPFIFNLGSKQHAQALYQAFRLSANKKLGNGDDLRGKTTAC